MIEMMEWSQLLNALEQSQLVRNVNNLIFIGYLILFLFNRKVVYFTAFFMCVILVESGVMQQTEEYEVYLLIAILYSYVFVTCKALKNKIGCGIILLLSLTLVIDSFLYGAGGYYGTSETFVYRNIESLALFSHAVFISSFIHYARIQNSLRSFFDSIVRLTFNSDYMLVFCYNSNITRLEITNHAKHKRTNDHNFT